MTDRKSKRAIIISNIKSESIEQAIFILKATAETAAASGGGLVAEAQEIINSYIKTIEGAGAREKKKNKRFAAVIMGGFAAAILLTCVLFKLQ